MAKQTEQNDELFGGGSQEQSSWLDKKQKNDDGLLRPKLEQGENGVRELTIRFLPNLQRDGKIGPTAIEKSIIYAKFQNNPELQGYFDSLKGIGKECPLTKTYWLLKNSKNPDDQDKASLINSSKKYYAYVYVVEDSQVPENEGKIFIFPFGYKIFEKIKAQKEKKKSPCKVEDLINGKDFTLRVKEVGGFYNYDTSEFEESSPITFEGKKLKVSGDNQISAEERQRVVDFLYTRTHELEEYAPKDWSPEQYDKAHKIIALLTGTGYDNTSNFAAPKSEAKPLAASNVFGDSDEDEDEDKPAKMVKATKSEKAEPVADASAAKKKAKAFFNDDEDEA